ncbi:hypothetical protein [Proteiniborus sp. MB09-C3]|uniref:hypothetical protein n=1 Tax=Proteiniborus sp. MB09-C3 TaxID=3050072 RepID=UPI002556FA75|nr:hypothetical protein [Proteiniborus sp. MB09-C3]WIV13201.1 hypothetical protein QO263_05690 [Proteiniborus sp. MB09-C3]
MEWINVIQTVGVTTAALIACAWFIYNKDKQISDGAKEREDKAYAREDKLMEVNSANAKALDKVADTINDSNAINKELSETNRMLVSKIDNQLNKIDSIDGNVNKILDKLNT